MSLTDRPRTGAVVPVRVVSDDDDLGMRRLRTVGYRCVCGCGYRSSLYRTWVGARAGLVAHRRDEHDGAG